MSEMAPITEDEWFNLFESDSELVPKDEDDGYLVYWMKHPDIDDAWFWYTRAGYIETKNPDEPLARKMLEIAFKLNARVQGDDGEFYEIKSDGRIYDVTERGETRLVEFVPLKPVIAEEVRGQRQHSLKTLEQTSQRQDVWWRKLWRRLLR